MEEKAKDKAKQILNNMAFVCRDNGNYPEVAKQCAIIAVEEIIEALENFGYADAMYDNFYNNEIITTDEKKPTDFWYDVRIEIERL